MTESDKDRIDKAVQQKVAELMELVHTIQVVATIHDPVNNETNIFGYGSGNIYARIASVDEWLSKQKT
jgi:ATP-dependent protease HslVU (ClpYQ) peptidase subunit